jgi:hypothetical protein
VARLPDLYLSMTLIDLNTSYWEESKEGVAQIHLMKAHLVVWILLFVDNIKNPVNNSFPTGKVIRIFQQSTSLMAGIFIVIRSKLFSLKLFV